MEVSEAGLPHLNTSIEARTDFFQNKTFKQAIQPLSTFFDHQ